MNALLGLLLGLLLGFAPTRGLADAPQAAPGVIELDCAKLGSISLSKGRSRYRIVGTCTKVSVGSSENKITIEAVKNLAVTGSKNEITVDKVDKIAVMGSNNKLIYGSGLTLATPKIATMGKGNTVTPAVASDQR